jgi:hypothetical protein
MPETRTEDVFMIHLPGGRVARVPASALEPFIDPRAKVAHPPDGDVTQHSASLDPATGASTWHTEWELGQCDFTDDAGNLTSAYVWHRHPLGTEYTEIYQK